MPNFIAPPSDNSSPPQRSLVRIHNLVSHVDFHSHNWHRAETNCIDWSRSQLTKLLADLPILSGQGGLHIKVRKVDKVDGEAYVNIRKGKIIHGYELSLSISWEGLAKDDNGQSLLKVEGPVEIPYLVDENAGEDPDLRVTVKDEGPVGKRLMDAMFTKGKPLFCKTKHAQQWNFSWPINLSLQKIL